MTLTYHLATAADLPQIVAIYNQIIPSRLATADLTPVTVASRTAWFAAFDPATRPLWVVRQGQAMAGWVGLENFYGRPAYAHTAEISIYFDQRFRHQGLGQATLTFVAGQLPALAIDTLVAYIFAHNVPSLALFRRNGFATWGELPDVALMDGQRRSLAILGRHYA